MIQMAKISAPPIEGRPVFQSNPLIKNTKINPANNRNIRGSNVSDRYQEYQPRRDDGTANKHHFHVSRLTVNPFKSWNVAFVYGTQRNSADIKKGDKAII